MMILSIVLLGLALGFVLKRFLEVCDANQEWADEYNKLVVDYNNLMDKYNKSTDEYIEVLAKLDSYKEVELISAPEIEMTEELANEILETDNDEGFLQYYVESGNKLRIKHDAMIRNIIDVLKAEGLIKNHITVEILDDFVTNCYTNTGFGGKEYNHKIRISYNFADRELMNLINNKFGIELDINSMPAFVFLHEFGHYVDRTLNHANDYEEINYMLKQSLDELEDNELRSIAYREIPSEAFADKWAIDFMKKHFPDYIDYIGSCVLA